MFVFKSVINFIFDFFVTETEASHTHTHTHTHQCPVVIVNVIFTGLHVCHSSFSEFPACLSLVKDRLQPFKSTHAVVNTAALLVKGRVFFFTVC